MPPHQRHDLYMGDESLSVSSSPVRELKPAEPKRKRKLRFSKSSNQVFHVVHINDMDKADVLATWYEKKEYDAIKNKLITLIRKMMKGEKIEETNKETVRGLEYRTRQGALRRQHNKLEGISAVMEEQQRQLDAGEMDDEKLAKAYRSASSHCQVAAHVMGVSDEENIKKELEESRQNPFKIEEQASTKSKSNTRGLNTLIKQVRIRRRTVDGATSPALQAQQVAAGA